LPPDTRTQDVRRRLDKGGELEPLMAGLQPQERQRVELRERLAALDAEPRQSALDPATVRQQLKDYLKDWRGLLLGQVGQPATLVSGIAA
jgi:hypothetical protein